MRSHRPTKKNPLPGTFYTHTQKGYRKKIDLRPCLLVPNVVEKKVFVIQKNILYETVSNLVVYDF